MLNVGLTGGIACGKSTVAQMFVRLGGHLIDFDKLAHEVQEPEKPAWQKIVQYFGEGILLPDKTIDRNRLGGIVFDDSKKLAELNRIVHPQVYQEWLLRLEKIGKEEKHAIVLSDVPLLFEGGMQHLFDLTVLVLTSPEDQISRLIARNGISHDEAQKRLKSQMPICQKVELASIIIGNQESISETEKKVREIWRELKQIEQSKQKNI